LCAVGTVGTGDSSLIVVDPGQQPDVVIRAGRRDDLLALLGIRLGFHPTESLLVGSVDGPSHRLGFVLRVDLPGPQDVDKQVAGIVQVLCSQRAQRVVVVALGTGGDIGTLVDTAVHALAEASIDVVEALVADGRRWWCRLCPDGSCGDPAGTAYDLTATSAMAQAVVAGVSVLPSRAALAEGFAAVPGPLRDAVTAAADDVRADQLRFWSRHGARRPLHRTPAVLTRGAAQVRRLLASAVESGPLEERHGSNDRLTAQGMAELAVLVGLVPVRDVAWSLMARSSARGHAAVWAQVSRYAPVELSAAPLALAGFASWLHGDGAAAWCAVERCLSEHPSYSMALLLSEALERALPPGMWSPPPAELLAAGLFPPVEQDDPAA
jgi:hypothetical protein